MAKVKNYLNDVTTLKYSPESELILKKGTLALLHEFYIDGNIEIKSFEDRKKDISNEIERLENKIKGVKK